MERDDMWTAVLDRDATRDGAFVYAVLSTSIYCRPSCPSRKPKREQVSFYGQPSEAEAAGFRACLRCHPSGKASVDPNVELMNEVCRYIEQCDDRIPTLLELSERFGLSPYHLQRTFKRIVGVSPRQYAGAYRHERFKRALKHESDVIGAVYSAGYGSGSSAYEESRDALGMTPTRYRQGGEETIIAYAVAPCALGWLLVAATERGLCAVRLGDEPQLLVAALQSEFPLATFQPDGAHLKVALAQLTEYLQGQEPHLDLPLDVKATAFQRQVWSALREIPYGATRSYQEVARAIGRPDAVRAVAGACAHNPVALVVPCHRVVRSDGSLGGYRWGIERKRTLLQQEASYAGQVEDAGSELG